MGYNIRIYKEPHNLQYAKQYICDAIDSSWICINGKYIDNCVDIFKEKLGVKHVILTDSGTSALHCCMVALKKKYPHITKLYVPNNVYVSLWNTAKLVFPSEMIEALDCDPDTWNIDTSLIDTLEKNSALFVVHNIGNIVNIPALKRKRPDIVFLEDNCEGFPGSYEGNAAGSESFVSTISFNMNKTVTSGHGGAFCTNDDETYEYIYDFVRVGSTRHQKYLYQFAGYTYGYTNLQAALLYSQLIQLDKIMERKQYVFEYYTTHLNHPKIKFQKWEENTQHSSWSVSNTHKTQPPKA